MAVPRFTDSTVDAEGLLNAFELRSDKTDLVLQDH